MILSEFERGQEEEEEEEEERDKGQATQEELVLESPATVAVPRVGEMSPWRQTRANSARRAQSPVRSAYEFVTPMSTERPWPVISSAMNLNSFMLDVRITN
ncbi:uncharacterized protein APUU_60157A [Aspergillus puulaauensis]|uniref:Uncharacterized protein n=1 Tax=Aspergillus puulaauensis TaxID=1220207 RepID=A0A7R7XTA8_9EURO|nr:uncharacterized protein APUU_60157A [Aspergillus puulaauensis]BCS27109.1 hypothetical protein APUU_60157A [Aspergillus puulaauensis]